MRRHDDVRFKNFNLHEEWQFQAAIPNRTIAGLARARRRSVTRLLRIFFAIFKEKITRCFDVDVRTNTLISSIKSM